MGTAVAGLILSGFCSTGFPLGRLLLLWVLWRLALYVTGLEQAGSLFPKPDPRNGGSCGRPQLRNIFYLPFLPLATEFHEIYLIALIHQGCSPPVQDRNVSQCFIFQAFFPFEIRMFFLSF